MRKWNSVKAVEIGGSAASIPGCEEVDERDG